MQRLITFISVLVFTTTLFTMTAYAKFMDVKSSHQNFNAINYLQDNGIINGYEDGTFKPYKKVNRAEFLKIILEGSGITSDISDNTPFPDIDHNAWYAPYIKKAYSEGWIVGYPNGTFKPEQTINKVEALKILGEVQNWELSQAPNTQAFADIDATQWYASYVAYAKDKRFLEESGENYEPAKEMTRANISEVIYRTLIAKSKTAQTVITIIPTEEVSTTKLGEPSTTTAVETITPPKPKTENLDFSPVQEKEINTDFYTNITLDYKIPNTYYKNEVYVIEGTVNKSGSTNATIYMGDKSGEIETQTVDLNNGRFKATMHFSETGNYNFGILPGESGETKITEISVLPSLPASSEDQNTPDKIQTFSISHFDDISSINYTPQASTINIISIYQGNEIITYISRQKIDKLDINYLDFKNFKEGKTYYYIESAKVTSSTPLWIRSAFINSDTKTFTAIKHQFSKIVDDKITATPPVTMNTVSPISFSGTVKTNTQLNAYIIKPDGFTEEFEMTTTSPKGDFYGNPTILSGGNFEFYYNPQSTGTYIIEINDEEGLPTINHPIYIGDGVPILPDEFDKEERSFFEGSVNLAQLRTELLNYINKSRTEHGLPEIKLAEDINIVAQGHTDDMAKNNFFGHINPKNESPEDRRIKRSIPTAVAENLAKDVSIRFAHLGLMRSAAHRDNILEKDWTRIGIGITLDEGYLLIAEEFSIEPQTTDDLIKYKNELITAINQDRTSAGSTEFINDPYLELAAKYLNDKEIDEGVELSNAVFSEALSINGITGTSQAIGRTFNIWSSILSSIINEEGLLLQNKWQNIGVDIQLDSIGDIHATIIVNYN